MAKVGWFPLFLSGWSIFSFLLKLSPDLTGRAIYLFPPSAKTETLLLPSRNAQWPSLHARDILRSVSIPWVPLLFPSGSKPPPLYGSLPTPCSGSCDGGQFFSPFASIARHRYLSYLIAVGGAFLLQLDRMLIFFSFLQEDVLRVRSKK